MAGDRRGAHHGPGLLSCHAPIGPTGRVVSVFRSDGMDGIPPLTKWVRKTVKAGPTLLCWDAPLTSAEFQRRSIERQARQWVRDLFPPESRSQPIIRSAAARPHWIATQRLLGLPVHEGMAIRGSMLQPKLICENQRQSGSPPVRHLDRVFDRYPVPQSFSRSHFDFLARSLVLGPVGLMRVTFLVRIVGLRSFSKMKVFDFISTVATGSLLANAATAVKWQSFAQSCISIGAILGVQCVLAWLRRKSAALRGLLENEPVLLMRDGKFQRAAMRETRVAESDMRAKMREANVLDPGQIRAVVLETTGDLSVLHGDRLDPSLLETVRTLDAENQEGKQ